MKASFKSSCRMFKKQLTRFLTIVAIVFVSVSFMFGLGETENVVDAGVNEIYLQQNVSDLIIKSTSVTGFSAEEISQLTIKFGEDNVMTAFCVDTTLSGSDSVRIYRYDLSGGKINKLELVEGSFPSQDNEILVERSTKGFKSLSVGDSVELFGETYNVCGVVISPLVVHKVGEPNTSGGTLDYIFYIDGTSPIVTDVFVTLSDRTVFDAFSANYEALISEVTSGLELDGVVVLSLYENYGLFSLHTYAQKVGKIAIIFVIFFMLVTALVIFSTMTRLIDEERSQIACLKTLGYSSFRTINKYLIFIALATLIGSALSFFVGIYLAKVLYIAFSMQYEMPTFPQLSTYNYYFLAFGIILVSSLLVTLLAGWRLTQSKPSELLLPKAPKAGKKVLLERIPIVWNRLSFKYKSSLRNVFLFKSRFFMTVVSIIGATVLVLAGLGLLDNALKIENSSSIVVISVTLLVFAALLCALVIYNITNINISERNREIATLMVLGYMDGEVSGYIFREIYIMSALGAIIGIPIGYFFMEFLFNFITFGSTSNVNWWTWIVGPVLTMIFTIISSMLLYKKIVKTDMNESLKTVE